MDETRRAYRNDTSCGDMPARTYKHYVISSDPGDAVSLDGLRDLAVAWARDNFPDYEVAIVYHDDNASRIPHAHVIVNNTNLATGRRLQNPDPRALKHNLQTLVKGRGLSDLDTRERERFGDRVPPRTMQRVSCTTDGYGRVTLDGRHRYLASPDLANAALTVATSRFHARTPNPVKCSSGGGSVAPAKRKAARPALHHTHTRAP
jgi:hypothetical protein